MTKGETMKSIIDICFNAITKPSDFILTLQDKKFKNRLLVYIPMWMVLALVWSGPLLILFRERINSYIIIIGIVILSVLHIIFIFTAFILGKAFKSPAKLCNIIDGFMLSLIPHTLYLPFYLIRSLFSLESAGVNVPLVSESMIFMNIIISVLSWGPRVLQIWMFFSMMKTIHTFKTNRFIGYIIAYCCSSIVLSITFIIGTYLVFVSL